MQRFTPKPENDFVRFYNLYYEECRRRVPQIAGIAAKWRFEDLIPGLSDFDARFLVEDGMTVGDWCVMSTKVGTVHLELCREYPHWARNLEHLPGINLTWSELTDATRYYPEYAQWTFYRAEAPARLANVEQYLQQRNWDEQDEYFHLKKFCLYHGRYNRQIDRPINLGTFIDKYPLHSRCLHYFVPALQSAVCLLLRRPVAGKLESLRLANGMYPRPVLREVSDIVDRHYEKPGLDAEPALTQLEDRLEQELEWWRQTIAPGITWLSKGSIQEWRNQLKKVRVNPAQRIVDGARFSRLMKGRLQFYADAPAHFDNLFLIENELQRLRQLFFDVPYTAYWEVTTGETIMDPAAILPRLYPDVLNREELRCTQEFVRLLPGHWEQGRQKMIVRELAAIFDGFYSGLTKISQRVYAMQKDPVLCK